MKFPIPLVAAWLLCVVSTFAGEVRDYAEKIAPLIDPTKLATLGERAANPRVQKYVYWLATARQERIDPQFVVARAVVLAGYKGEASKLTADAMKRNLYIAERLGCTNQAGMDDMRRGQAPTIQYGPYRGDELSVDHIIPRSVVPELDNVIANLELMSFRMNAKKKAQFGRRQRDLAVKLNAAGLLSRQAMKPLW